MNCNVNVSVDSTTQMGKTGPINSTDDLVAEYPDQFKGIGCFPGKYTIHLKEDAQPIIHPPRKCPIAVKPKVKEELDKMVALRVITPVDEPTDWVSSLVQKGNGEICICLDPHDLNKAI